MTAVYSGAISGRSSGYTDGTATGIVATTAVTLDSDNRMRWVDSDGNPRSVQLTGHLAVLIKEIFTGAGGATQAIKE